MQPAFTTHPAWTWIQRGGILATVVLVGALVLIPEFALGILWFAIIPILPATFMLSPAIWRGVCPLATLNMLLNGRCSQRILRARFMTQVGAAGIILLALMVPARRFLFNENALALTITIVAICITAMVLGAFFDLKSGFCNAICPVLPVERLYGQRPLVDVANPRCDSCTLCTNKACIDLVPERSLLIAMGPGRNRKSWFLTAYGIFSAAFPGFAVGYFLTTDGPLNTIGTVYLTVIGWSFVSWLLVAVIVKILRLRPETVVPVLGAAAVLIYYWFSAPAIVAEFVLHPLVGTTIRIASFSLVGIWLWKKYADARGTARFHTMEARTN